MFCGQEFNAVSVYFRWSDNAGMFRYATGLALLELGVKCDVVRTRGFVANCELPTGSEARNSYNSL